MFVDNPAELPLMAGQLSVVVAVVVCRWKRMGWRKVWQLDTRKRAQIFGFQLLRGGGVSRDHTNRFFTG